MGTALMIGSKIAGDFPCERAASRPRVDAMGFSIGTALMIGSKIAGDFPCERAASRPRVEAGSFENGAAAASCSGGRRAFEAA